MPGDPAQMMLGQNQSREQLQLVKKNMGLTFLFGSNLHYILMIYHLYPSTQQIKRTFLIIQKKNIVPYR